MINDMRKLMEAINSFDKMKLQEINEVHGASYAAAYLYLNGEMGVTKPEMAKVMSEAIGISYDAAAQMIDAIDAYEDIRESEEFKA